MDEDKDKERVVQAAKNWYRYILRSGESLSKEERDLLNAVFNLQVKVKDSLKKGVSKALPYTMNDEEERPTTPVPFNLQEQLKKESKKE